MRSFVGLLFVCSFLSGTVGLAQFGGGPDLDPWKALVERMASAPVAYRVEVTQVLVESLDDHWNDESIQALVEAQRGEGSGAAGRSLDAAIADLTSREPAPGVRVLEPATYRFARAADRVVLEGKRRSAQRVIRVGDVTAVSNPERASLAIHNRLRAATRLEPASVLQPCPESLEGSWTGAAAHEWEPIADATYRLHYTDDRSRRRLTVRLDDSGVPLACWVRPEVSEESILAGFFEWEQDASGPRPREVVFLSRAKGAMTIVRYRISGWVEPAEAEKVRLAIDAPSSIVDMRDGTPRRLERFEDLPEAVRDVVRVEERGGGPELDVWRAVVERMASAPVAYRVEVTQVLIASLDDVEGNAAVRKLVDAQRGEGIGGRRFSLAKAFGELADGEPVPGVECPGSFTNRFARADGCTVLEGVEEPAVHVLRVGDLGVSWDALNTGLVLHDAREGVSMFEPVHLLQPCPGEVAGAWAEFWSGAGWEPIAESTYRMHFPEGRGRNRTTVRFEDSGLPAACWVRTGADEESVLAGFFTWEEHEAGYRPKEALYVTRAIGGMRAWRYRVSEWTEPIGADDAVLVIDVPKSILDARGERRRKLDDFDELPGDVKDVVRIE